MSSRRRQPSGATGRPPLSRDRVVRAALQVLDREGLRGLTMRALGRELGVDPMAIYHYVPNKESLFDAIVEAIYAELEIPAAEGPWQEQMAAFARALRAVLLAHPEALPVVATRQNTGEAGLAALDHAIGVLRAAGFSPARAIRVVSAAGSFIIGHALSQVGRPAEGVEDVSAEAFLSAVAGGHDAPRYPNLDAALREGGLGDELMDETFEAGLALLVAGLEQEALDRAGRSGA